jgi:hypothetical protein
VREYKGQDRDAQQDRDEQQQATGDELKHRAES